MSLPPTEIPLGAIRFNSDSRKLEYWMGSTWRQIHTFSPTIEGGVRGIFFGGNNGSTYDDIEFISISTQGNATDFGNLTQNKLACGTCGSRTRGIAAAGQTSPGFSNVINFITFSSTGNASDFGDTTNKRDFLGGLSNETRGLFFGGRTPTPQSHIDFITIAAEGNAVDFGDLISARQNYPMDAASATRGIIAGGVSGTQTFQMDFVTIATTGNGRDFGQLSNVIGGAGASNSIRGIFAGGYFPQPSITDNIDFSTIATLGNSTAFGDLSAGRRGLAGVASLTRACFGGGSTPTDVNTIDYIEIATGGNAVDFGDLGQSNSGKKKNVTGCSNGHGGLG